MARIVKKHRNFLEAFKITASVSKAAKAAGIDRTMHYRWLEDVPGYAAAFEAAKDEAAQTLEDEAIRRAHEGVVDAVFYKGKAVGAKRIYSDGLIMFLLRAMRPEKYRRDALEVTGANGGPIEVSVADVLRDRKRRREGAA